jgi:hypothetical protein
MPHNVIMADAKASAPFVAAFQVRACACAVVRCSACAAGVGSQCARSLPQGEPPRWRTELVRLRIDRGKAAHTEIAQWLEKRFAPR